MDTLSHALWGYGLFGYKRYAWLAIFFGAMPDLISFGIFLVLEIFQGGWHLGKPALETIPHWVFIAYSLGHSFVISLPIIYIIYKLNKKIALAMLAWPFHIILDFPFHSLSYFATPIFWPVSDFKLNGIPWSHWYIWYPNIFFLSLLLVYRHKQKKLRRP